MRLIIVSLIFVFHCTILFGQTTVEAYARQIKKENPFIEHKIGDTVKLSLSDNTTIEGVLVKISEKGIVIKENKGATVLYSFNALSLESRGKLYPAEYEKWVTRESISRVESDKEKSIREEKAEDKLKKLKAEQETLEIEKKLSRISTILQETIIVQIINQKTLLARPLYKYTGSNNGFRQYDTNGGHEQIGSTYNNIVCITGVNTEGLVDNSVLHNGPTNSLFIGYEVGTYTYTSVMGVKKTVKKITADKKEAIEFLEKK